MPGKPKTDTDSYSDTAEAHIETLVEKQLKEMGSAKIIMNLYIRWKNLKELDDDTGDNYIRIEMPFNSLMTKFFEGSDINKLIKRMLAHIKAQNENPKFPESGFTLDKIMHLYINFHRLVLSRGSSYIELPGWIKTKKAVINPQSQDEECFKLAVIEALATLRRH